MTDTKGYIAEEEYTSDYHRYYTPAFLDYVALLSGVAPPERKPGQFRFCDLGCGFGMTALALAAGNPEAEVHGIDFMPEHVDMSTRIATQAGLGNAHFHAMAFADALEHPFPQFDYIVAHGVYSWVGADIRAEVVEFMRRFLAPGGIAYISYNAMPGWAQAAPVQKFVSSYSQAIEGDGAQRVLKAFATLERVLKSPASTLHGKPAVSALLNSVKTEQPQYLAHEYLHSSWEPRYFIDVSREVAKAELTYAGTATLFAADERFTIASPEHHALLSEMPSAEMRESLKDYLLDVGFRRDVYTRGGRKLAPTEREKAFAKRGFALQVSADAVNYVCAVGMTEVNIDFPATRSVVSALASGAKTIAELRIRWDLVAVPFAVLYDILLVLAISEQITPVETTEGRSHQLNQVLKDHKYPCNALASPLGVGTLMSVPEMMLSMGPDLANVDALVTYLQQEYARTGRPVLDSKNTPIASAEAQTAFLRTAAADFLHKKKRAFAALGVLATA